MDSNQVPRSREGLTLALMALGAFVLAVLAGFAVSGGKPPTRTQEEPRREGLRPANSEPLQKHKDAPPPPKPLVVSTPVKDAGQDNPAETGAGPVVSGLQFVLSVNQKEIEPGDELVLSWKLINHLETQVQFFDVAPSVVLKKPGFEQGYPLVGEPMAPTADQLKTIASKSTMTFSRTIEWPKQRRNPPPGWPNYAAPGPCTLSIGFLSENNARAAEQLRTERGLEVYHERLESGAISLNIKVVENAGDEDHLKPPNPQQPPPEEQF